MAIYRSVSSGFWTDTKVVDMFTPEDKYFMLYLLTNPHATLLGCYEISTKQISAEMGYTTESVLSLIERFKTQYKIIDYSPETKEMLIKNWHRYNWTSSPKCKAALEKGYKCIKNEQFKSWIREAMKLRFSDIDIGNKVKGNRYEVVGNRSKVVPIDVCIGYGYGIDRVSGEQNAQKAPSQLYGIYKNVLLTEEELKQLKTAYSDWKSKIDRLSTYIKQTGKRYENHYAVITAWAEEDAKKNPEKVSSFETDDFYRTALSRTYGEEGGEGV